MLGLLCIAFFGLLIRWLINTVVVAVVVVVVIVLCFISSPQLTVHRKIATYPSALIQSRFVESSTDTLFTLSTYCHQRDRKEVERDWYRMIRTVGLDSNGLFERPLPERIILKLIEQRRH